VGFIDAFADFMPHQIVVEPWDGTFNAEGAALHGASIPPMNCRVQERVRRILDPLGVERVSNVTLFVAGGPLSIHDKIILPATFGGGSPPILHVANHHDETGFCYSEVFL
jgi:hypothetical protein